MIKDFVREFLQIGPFHSELETLDGHVVKAQIDSRYLKTQPILFRWGGLIVGQHPLRMRPALLGVVDSRDGRPGETSGNPSGL